MLDLTIFIEDVVRTVIAPRFAELVLSLANIGVVVYWRYKFKSIQGGDTIIRTLREQLLAKDCIISNLERAKSNYKMQYDHLLNKYKQAKGELATYYRFNKHKPPAGVDNLPPKLA